MEKFFDYCKEYILDRLSEFEGSTHYGCDFCREISMYDNTNGTCTYDRRQAEEYLKGWWNECGAYWQYEKDNFGEHLWNPFDDPEAYMCCMVIEGCAAILGDCKTLQDSWDDRLELTDEVLDAIREEVREQTERELF